MKSVWTPGRRPRFSAKLIFMLAPFEELTCSLITHEVIQVCQSGIVAGGDWLFKTSKRCEGVFRLYASHHLCLDTNERHYRRRGLIPTNVETLA